MSLLAGLLKAPTRQRGAMDPIRHLQRRDDRLHSHLRAELTRVIEQHAIEARPLHLERAVQTRDEALAENDLFHPAGIGAMKLRAILRDKAGRLDFWPYADFAQHTISRRQQRLADVETGKRALLDDERAQSVLSRPRRRAAPRRSSADHQYIILEFRHYARLRREVTSYKCQVPRRINRPSFRALLGISLRECL